MAAYVLAQAGLKVVMLEAGRDYRPVDETPMMNLNLQAPLRGAGTPDKPFGFYDATVNGGWNVPGEPYTTAPGHRRSAGGGRACWAGGPTTGAGSRCAWGPTTSSRAAATAWASTGRISYEDLAPYYDKVEALIGVWGTNEGMENTPDSSAGVLLPAPAPRGYERYLKKHGDRIGVPVIPSRIAVLSKPLDHETRPQAACTPTTRGRRQILADSHAEAAGLHLGHALRARLQHRGELPVDHRADPAGAWPPAT